MNKKMIFGLNTNSSALLMMFLLFGMSGCNNNQVDKISLSVVKTDLSLSKTPNLGETADLYATISSVKNINDATSTITLPSGIQYISGNLSWKGNLVANQPAVYGAKIKVLENGQWKIDTRCESAIHSLYLSVKDGTGTLYENGFPTPKNPDVPELSTCPPNCQMIDDKCVCP